MCRASLLAISPGALVALIASAPLLADASELPGMASIDFAIEKAEANQRMIRSGSGTAELLFERRLAPDFSRLEPELAAELGQGVERQTIEWHMNGAARRSDRCSAPLLPDEEPLLRVPTEDRRACTGALQVYMMEHPARGWEAYIQVPDPDDLRMVRSVFGTFDPMVYFRIDTLTLREQIQWLEQSGYTITAQEEQRDEGRLLIISAQSTDEPARRVEIVCDPAQAYNVVQYQFHNADYGEEPCSSARVVYGVFDGGRVFFPVHYHLFRDFGKDRFSERVEVSFANVRLNETVDPALFTLAGLGIENGTRVFDRRYDKVKTAYFGRIPSDELDRLVAMIQSSIPLERRVDPPAPGTIAAGWVLGAALSLVGILVLAYIAYRRHISRRGV